MCRLFGFRSSLRTHAHRSLVHAENALAEQAAAHPHGWGIGWYVGDDAYLIKSESAAHTSESFRRAADQLESNVFIAHVRRATVGAVSPLNVHPFRSGRWLFAHNGTIDGFEALRPQMLREIPEHLRGRILGTTDTETLFFWLLGRMCESHACPDGRGVIEPERLGELLTDAVAELRHRAAQAGADRPILNFLLTNGDVFLAHRHGRELYFATQKRVCADAETCVQPRKVCLEPRRPSGPVNHLIVASERIGDTDQWEEVPEGGMVILSKDFNLTFRGPGLRLVAATAA